MAMQDWLNNPWTVLGAGMMGGSDPNRSGLGGVGQGIMQAGQVMRDQSQLAIENQNMRDLAEIQMRTFAAKLNKPPNMGNTPLYFRDPTTGALKIGRFGPQGVQFPETQGLTPVRPVSTVDIGGQQVIMPYGAETPTGVIQKTLTPEAMPETRAAQAVAVEQAKGTQAAAEKLPGAQMESARTLRYIDELEKHPGLDSSTGWTSMLPVAPGSDRADFEARKRQLMGGVFLQAYERLKGGGTITEIESEKAEQAMARIDAATSKKAFKEALADYKSAVRDGMAKLRRRAGQPASINWSDL